MSNFYYFISATGVFKNVISSLTHISLNPINIKLFSNFNKNSKYFNGLLFVKKCYQDAFSNHFNKEDDIPEPISIPTYHILISETLLRYHHNFIDPIVFKEEIEDIFQSISKQDNVKQILSEISYKYDWKINAIAKDMKNNK